MNFAWKATEEKVLLKQNHLKGVCHENNQPSFV